MSYIMAGYPKKEDTVDLLLGLQEGGTDVIELGIPFTDPQADGPTIERAHMVRVESLYTHHMLFSFLIFLVLSLTSFTSILPSSQEALKNGVKLKDCFEYVKQARYRGLTAPVVLMGYLNPCLAYGLDQMVHDAKATGVDG